MDANEDILRPLPHYHEPWLRNAEQKLTKAIEVLHDLYCEILLEGTKNKVLEGEAKGCQCGLEKQVLENKCKELELEKKRCTTDFDAKVQMWREKFHKLKKQYKVLREAVSPKKGNRSHRKIRNNEAGTSSKGSSQNIVCDESKTKTSCDDVDKRKENAMEDNVTKVAAQGKLHELCYVADTEDVDMTKFTEDSKLHDVPKAAYTKTTSVDLIDVVTTRDSFKGIESSLGNSVSKEVELTKNRSISENHASSKLKSAEDLCAVSEITKSYAEEPTEPSWKSSGVVLRGKHNSRVVYHDKVTKGDTKTIPHFFKPKPVKLPRNITSRRSKRQKSEADLDSPEKKRSKEARPDLLKHKGIIDLANSDCKEKKKIRTASDIDDMSIDRQLKSLEALRNSIVKVDQLDAITKQNSGRGNHSGRSKTTSTAASERRVVSSNVLKQSEPIRKVTCFANDTTETISLAEESEINRLSKTPVESTTRRNQFQSLASSKSRPVSVDNEVTHWDVEEHVGLPSLASTPVMPFDNDHKNHSSGKDFDETMWSAPQSPSVVRSIFSTPEKKNDGPVSTGNERELSWLSSGPSENGVFCNAVSEAYEDQPKPSSTKHMKEAIPILLTDSQSYLKEARCDSPHQSKGNHILYKTSEADLSCDMFNGETASSIAQRGDDTTQNHNTSGEDYLAEGDGILDEQETKNTEKPNKTESFQSFEKKVSVDVNYKYNAVVRKRDQRDKMDGFECPECAAVLDKNPSISWINDASFKHNERNDGQQQAGFDWACPIPYWYADEPDCEEKRKHLKLVCRHKTVSSPPPDTPEDFWSVGFPQTPEYMGKRYMLNENDTLPTHAKPMERRRRRDRSAKDEDDGRGET